MPGLQPVQTEDVALILCHPIDMRCGRGQVRSLFCRTRTGSQRARSKPAVQAEAADALAISVLQKLRPGDRRSGCAFEVDVKCAPFVLAARLIAAVYPSELTGFQRSLAGLIQLRPKLRVSGVQITVRLLENLVKEERMFFFEKKNQKTFVLWRTLPERRVPTSKSFLLLFFKKEVLSSFTT